MTTWRVVLPAGLDNKNFERGEVVKLGGEPPIRFVPSEAKKESQAPLSTFTQKVSDDAKESFARFQDGTLEDAIKHIIQFNALSKKLGYQTKAKIAKKAYDAFVKEKDAEELKDPSSSKLGELRERARTEKP